MTIHIGVTQKADVRIEVPISDPIPDVKLKSYIWDFMVTES